MIHYSDTFETPLGPFSIAVNHLGAVVATAFGNATALRKRAETPQLNPDVRRLAAARKQVLDFFAGDRREFSLALAPDGTAFQQRVWAALAAIPFGETRTYGQLAARLGNPGASRAVGRANATNPICLIIPCHRVIGADGSMRGFAFGERIKRRLLDHEHAVATGSSPARARWPAPRP